MKLFEGRIGDYTVVGVERCPVDQNEIIVTCDVKTKTTLLGRLFNRKPKQWRVQFRGSCTVWYWHPQFVRCDTWIESKLVAVWKRWQYETKLAAATSYDHR